jgi:triosephosphate isomerase
VIRRPFFAANWKMHHGPTKAREFMAAFGARWTPRADRTVVIFPPAISVSTVVHALGARHDIGVGVQNVWTEDRGAFTGETSAPMAAEAGAKYVLVGHSERRHVFGETDEQTARKLEAAIRNHLVPVLCVGELLEERHSGQTEAVVLGQLRAALSNGTVGEFSDLVIAYEPVWAIGTGKNANPDDAAIVQTFIRGALGEWVGARAADVPILYGGSVTAANAPALLAAENIDGLLVGGSSLDADTWATICDT